MEHQGRTTKRTTAEPGPVTTIGQAAPARKTTRKAAVRPVVPLFTVDQAREILHISRDQIYRLMRSGALDWRVIGEKRRIRSDDLASFIEREKGSGAFDG